MYITRYMKLLLTSAGLSNRSIVNALLELAGKPFSELNLGFIPTASNVESGDKDWLINDLIICKNLGFQSIDIVDFSAVSKDVWLPRLHVADILFFEGGNVFHLMYWIERSGLKEILPEMLKTKVYVGASSGSMVMSKRTSLNHFQNLYNEDVKKFKKEDGLGFVDFQIRSHLNSLDFPEMNITHLEELAKETSDTIYAIDDNTAIKISDEKMEIISEGAWKKFN